MQILTLQQIKANSRVEGDEEDDFLLMLGETAEEAVERAIRCSWDDVIAENHGSVPKPLRHACLMLVDEWYCHRGGTSNVSVNKLPHAVKEMINPFVRLI